MANLMPTDIALEVRQVLLKTPDAGRYGRSFLTAYQILERLPQATRDRLIAERGLGGVGTGPYTAPSVVSDSAESLPGIEILAVDTRVLTVQITGQAITPSSGVVAIYRLKQLAGE